MKRVFTTILVICMGINLLSAQTKSETKAYNNSIKKSTVKAFDSFLQKYPESVYKVEIMTLRDNILFNNIDAGDIIAVERFASEHQDSPIIDSINSIIDGLNVSSITNEEALTLFETALADRIDGKSHNAIGYKSHGIEYVVGVICGLASDSFFILGKNGEIWSVVDELPVEKDNLIGPIEESILIDSFEILKIGKTRSLIYNTLNYSNKGHKVEYIASLYSIEDRKAYSSVFYGDNMLPNTERKDYSIEGQDPSSLSTGLVLAEEIFLKNAISSNSKLSIIADADLKAENAIDWWYEKNPKAETSAKSISFGVIDQDNALVEQFAKTSKETSGNYKAALFDYRNQTVICAYNTKTKEYFLAWCEPKAENKSKDKFLNTIYFEKESTLCMFYYKGKTTFKIRLNLANKSLVR